jgi:xylan 1,4-beta-xylosidase
MSRTAENQFMVTMRARFTIAVMRALVIAVAFQPVLGAGAVGAQVLDPVAEQITVTAGATATPLPHFWEQMFGSGRAILSLRESYRQDLRAVRAVTAFRYVRFHNILHDEVGVYGLDAKGRAKYNFSYVDQIYDGLLENGIRPFVEISFMPRALSSDRTSEMDFWYRPNRAPPKDYARWDDLVRAFVAHLVDRYGIDEVAQWYFEVWNEPNIDFWSGRPKQRTYFTLYDHTARDVKSVSGRLRVGGPATAQAAWVSDFLRHAHETGVPVDFVSSHVYANDTAENVLGTHEGLARDRMVCRAARKVHEEIARSANPGVPFILSEYNASYANEPDVTDSIFMGPWLADTIRQCDGQVDLMSYWSFSDVFEEQGVVQTPFYGGFGLVAERGIAKPAFNAFALLHKLGETRLAVDADDALVTRRADGTLVVALWYYMPPDGTGPRYAGPPAAPRPMKMFSLRFEGAAAGAAVTLWRLDADHGNVLRVFDALGRPAFPTRAQIEQLQAAAHLPAPEHPGLENGTLQVAVPAQGLVVLELTR